MLRVVQDRTLVFMAARLETVGCSTIQR